MAGGRVKFPTAAKEPRGPLFAVTGRENPQRKKRGDKRSQAENRAGTRGGSFSNRAIAADSTLNAARNRQQLTPAQLRAIHAKERAR